MFGGEQRLADLLRLRLGEHAVHTWDIAVMRDAGGDASTPTRSRLLIDHLGQLVARACKAPADPVDVAVSTEEPARSFRLSARGRRRALTPATTATGRRRRQRCSCRPRR